VPGNLYQERLNIKIEGTKKGKQYRLVNIMAPQKGCAYLCPLSYRICFSKY
jgi:hypothetical protein